jgi:surface protein
MWRGHKKKRDAKWKAKIERSHQLGVDARKAWKADELLIVIDDKKGGEELASKLLHELYPQLATPFDNKSIRDAVKEFIRDEKEAVDKYGPIRLWDVSNVTNMDCMFDGCNMFNSNLSRWDVSKVTDMGCMFLGCNMFNSNLSRWDVSQVTDMFCMFYACKGFNSNLSRWDVSKVTDITCMFKYCDDFDETHKPKFKKDKDGKYTNVISY